MRIKLNKDEVELLLSRKLLPDQVSRNLARSRTTENAQFYVLDIGEDDADEMRDRFGEELQRYGFDENYKATREGRILESLIDKFFIG